MKLSLEEFTKILKESEDHARRGLERIHSNLPDRPPLVGKHQAKNWNHLQEVLAEAETACPRAADTIYWLLWHDVLRCQRVRLMAEELITGSSEET